MYAGSLIIFLNYKIGIGFINRGAYKIFDYKPLPQGSGAWRDDGSEGMNEKIWRLPFLSMVLR